MTNCPICKAAVPEYSAYGPKDPKSQITCAVCGVFTYCERLATNFPHRLPVDRTLIQGAIRELNEVGVTPWIDEFERLFGLVRLPRDPLDKMDRLLISLGRRTIYVDQPIVNNDETDPPLAYARNYGEYCILLRMLEQEGFLSNAQGSSNWGLTPLGWKRFRELTRESRLYNQAFVAMSFHPDLNQAWEAGIKPAVIDSGYEPIRIDRKEHNDKIDDLIIAEIRRSGLLIADFSGQRQGVYFEAGFALGLGIPVIWMCRKEEVEDLHFDTRQYNHILWADPDDLFKQLLNRIRATAPAPTLKTNSPMR